MVLDGTTAAIGVETGELEDLAGRGADCCIFLTAGSGGFFCERFSSLRWDLIFRTMSAKRHPGAPFPGCFLP